MAESIHSPERTLVYFSHLHEAQWLVPCVAWILEGADPRVEIIEEHHPYFDAYAELAGPKPE